MLKARRFLLVMGAIFLFSLQPVHAEAVLTITNAQISPKFPQPGGPVTVSMTVKNIGNEAVPGRTSLGLEFYSSTKTGQRTGGDSVQAIPWYTNNIEPLGPNQTQTISGTATLNKEGYHTAFAIIVNENFPLEKVRVENGSRNLIFEIARPSDLVLERIYLNHQGQLIIQMYNAGYKIPDEQYNNSSISVRAGGGHYLIPLQKAATRTIQTAGKSGLFGIPVRHTFKWPMAGDSGFKLNPAVKTKVEVTLDYNQSINDAKLQNNTKKEELGGGPDLVVCFKKQNHNNPNQNAWYPPYVKNIGYASAGPSKLRFWIEDDGVKTYNIPALQPGQEYRGVNRKVYWIRVKNHKFRLTADNGNSVNEFDETNNVIEGWIFVGKYGNNTATLCSDSPGMTGYQ